MSTVYSGTHYGDVSPRVGVFLVTKMLEHARPITVLGNFGSKQPLPKNKGETLKFRRPVPLAVNPVALQEGITPAPSAMDYDDVNATIAQYGGWIAITDKIQDLHEDPVLRDAAEMVGEAAANTKELLIWEAVRGGSQVIFTGVATQRSQVVATLTETELRQAQKELKKAHGKYLTKMMSASGNIGTEAVAPAFLAFGNTSLEGDLRDLAGFVPREKYGSGSVINEYEIGKFEDIRFILTPTLVPWYGAGAAATSGVENDGTNADVHALVIMAKDYFATTELAGMGSVAVTVTNPKMGTPGDELGQRGSVAWKMWFVAFRLNETWGVRIETAASEY